MIDITAIRDELCAVRSFVTCASDASTTRGCDLKAVSTVLEVAIEKLREIDKALLAVEMMSAVCS